MRMWMVDPSIMCRKHLLGEHVELHMFVGTINRGISLAGYLADNLLEPKSLYSRHEELVAEMVTRGYKHKSVLIETIPEFAQHPEIDTKINTEAALAELVRRCPECSVRYWEKQNGQ